MITDTGRGAMEAITTDLEAAGFGLGMLSGDDQMSLFSLLRRVRVAAGNFVEAPGVDGH